MSEVSILYSALCNTFQWNKSRIECFAMIIIGMISAQSVNLANISDHAKQSKKIKYDSIYKRIQRFFTEFDMPLNDIAKFVFTLFDFTSSRLIIDRTNWWYGKKHINYLVLSVRYKNVAIPLLWVALGKCANSTAAERIDIVKRFIICFGKSAISDFCGDREFACIKLLKYLLADEIPFTLRLKRDFKVKNKKGKSVKIKKLFLNMKPGEQRLIRQLLVLKSIVDVVGYKKICGELVILATNHNIESIQDRYINRNQIETMFKAMKTQGFNLEDTHLTDPKRVERLMGAVVISFAWSYKVGDYIDEVSPIKIKSNNQRLRSVFKTGFKFLINLFSNLHNKIKEIISMIALIFNNDYSQIRHINFKWL